MIGTGDGIPTWGVVCGIQSGQIRFPTDTCIQSEKNTVHELPIAQSILDIVLRHAESAEAKQISGIYLVIGQLSSFVDESIQFYWDILSKDTIAVGATLHFRRIPAQLRCRDCQHEYSLDGRDSACPACESINVEVVAGDELFVEAIDIESDDQV